MEINELAEEEEPVRALYYGDPGTRKSTNAAMMAKLGKVLIIDTEEGVKPSALKRQGVPTENIQVARRATFTELEDMLYEWFGKIDDGDPLPYVGVVFDSATGGTDRFVADLVRQQVQKADAKGEYRASFKVYQDDYGDMTNQMRNILRGLRDLPVHLAITAHARRDKDENDAIRVGPAVNPGLQQTVTGYADIIVHTNLTTVNDEEVGYGDTAPIGKFDGKDRFGVLPRSLVNPSFDRLVAYVDGEIIKGQDPVQSIMKAKPQTDEEDKDDKK